jgi:hypothetical protein
LSTIVRLENGKLPKLDRFARIATALNFTVGELFDVA